MSVSMSAPMSEDRSYHVLDAVPSRLAVSPARGRRRWSAEAKARLVEETLKPEANVSAIARAAGVSPSQLFGWRRQAILSGAVTPPRRGDAKELGFVEIGTAAPSMVEISLGDAVIRAGWDVDPDYLVRIIRAVRQA